MNIYFIGTVQTLNTSGKSFLVCRKTRQIFNWYLNYLFSFFCTINFIIEKSKIKWKKTVWSFWINLHVRACLSFWVGFSLLIKSPKWRTLVNELWLIILNFSCHIYQTIRQQIKCSQCHAYCIDSCFHLTSEKQLPC